MKTRPTWLVLPPLVLLACGTRTIGSPQGPGNNGSSNSETSSGSNGASRGGATTIVDGGTTTVNSPGGATSGPGLVLPEQTWRLTSNEYANTVSDLLGIAPSA